MNNIQRKSIRKPHGLLRRRKSSVGVMRVSRLSSQMAQFARQSNIANQQQTNSGGFNAVQTSTFPNYRNKTRMFTSLPNQSFSTDVNQYPSLKQNETDVPYSRTLTPTNVRHMRTSKVSSFTTSLDSKSSIRVSTNSRKSNLIFPSSNIVPTREQTQQQTISKIKQNRSIWNTKQGSKINGRRNKKVCRICSRCCCLASIPLLALLLIGLAAMFVGLSTIGKTTTTTTTSTTSTTTSTSTSSTSTSTTSTTTTTTTSTTTSTSTSTTTSTTTTTTTSTTSSTTTSSSTSSTSTSSTSTSTASTTSTTSKTTTTTTTPNPCGTPTYKGSASNLFSTTSGINSYTCKYYQWVSPTSGTVTLAFELENEPDKWHLDDVSVSDGTAEMLQNGGFESGSFSPGWIKTTPNGNCNGASNQAHIVSSSCRTGTYCVFDGCISGTDFIKQSFVAVAGQSYFVSFWLTGGDGFGDVSASVTLS